MRTSMTAAVLAGMTLTACTATVSGSGQAAPGRGAASGSASVAAPSGPTAPRPTTAAPPGAPSTTPLAPARWVHVVDQPTGVGFRLPGRPDLRRQASVAKDGKALENRLYEVGSDVTQQGVVVSVESAKRVQPMRWGSLDALPARLVAQFRAVGSKDVVVLQKKHFQRSGYDALSFRLRFTPLERTDTRAVWLLSAFNAGSALVLVQVIGTAPRASESRVLASERAVQRRIVDSLQLG